MQDTVSVLTLNIRFGLADDGPNSWQFRKDTFPALFEKYSADFMAFQEVNNFQVDDLAGILAGYERVGQRVPAPPFWQNNVIFYRRPWRCIHYDHFFLSPTPDIPSRFRESRWPRQCTLAMFERGKCQVICINTHFDFKEAVQTASATVILDRLSRLTPRIPTILMGDFNASPDAPCHRSFAARSGESDTAREPGFRNAFKAPYPATHHGFSGARIGDHIDWILYRGGLSLKRSRVIHDRFNGRYPSDHFPLLAEFCWAPPGR
jgi:endonuclease/exonuclease/phosphatase family metal-dependent hydrolase